MYVREIDTVGFTFRGEILCHGCVEIAVRRQFRDNPELSKWPLEDSDGSHEVVGQYARAKGEAIYAPGELHTYDTDAFCSDDVPKAFEDAEEGELCMECTAALV